MLAVLAQAVRAAASGVPVITVLPLVAPVYVGSTSVALNSVNVTPAIPTGTLAGDLMILVQYVRQSSTTIPTAPAGWTLRYDNAGGSRKRLFVWSRVYVPGDAAPLCSNTGGNEHHAHLISIRGQHASPFDAHSFTYDDGTSGLTARQQPSVTATTPDLIVDIWAWNIDSTSSALTLDTARQETRLGFVGSILKSATRSAAVGPTTGASASTPSGGAESYAHSIAIRPGLPAVVSPIAFGSAATPTVGSGTSWSVALPACAVGNVRVLNINSIIGSGQVTTIPAGWTLIRESLYGSSNLYRMTTCYRIKEPGDTDANVTVGWSGASSGLVGAYSLTGTFDPNTPIGPTAFASLPAGNSAITSPTVTTLVDNALVLSVYWYSDPAGSITTSGTGQTQRANQTDATWGTVIAATTTKTPAGSQSGATFGGASATNHAAQTIAVNPYVFVDPTDAFLKSNVGYWDGLQYSGSGNVLNLGTVGSAGDMIPGLTTKAPTWDGTNKRWQFDGVDDFMATAGDVDNFDLTALGSDFTVWAVVLSANATQVNTGGVFVKRSTSTSTGWGLTAQPDLTQQFTVRDSGVAAVGGAAPMAQNTKTLLCGTCVPGSPNKIGFRYNDGTLATINDARTANNGDTTRTVVGTDSNDTNFATPQRFHLYAWGIHRGAFTSAQRLAIMARYSVP